MSFDPNSPLMTAKNLSLIKHGKEILYNLSFSLEPGYLHFILGPNGAGKSLLLRLLKGLETATHGTLHWRQDLPVLSRRLLFQKPILLERSVEQNLHFAAKCFGLNPSICRARLADVGLSDRCKQPAGSLSGGEQQKLAFARETLGLDTRTAPILLLLDEPTANLDTQATQEVEALLLESLRVGVQALMASHDLHQIQRLAKAVPSRILFLDQGKNLFQGSAEAFFDEGAMDSRPAPIQFFVRGQIHKGAT